MEPALDLAFLTLLALIGFAALLYSAVGHGGASGYLAAMALLGVAPVVMKPTALVLNIFVAGLVWVRLARAGYFRLALFWPLVVGSIPLAYLGGAYRLQDHTYQYIVALALLIAAWRLLLPAIEPATRAAPKLAWSLPIGAGLGWVSGLTGVGGGIFLSPLLLFLHWSNMRETAALSAGFIVVNSIAALAGLLTTGAALPAAWPWLLAVALLGGIVGSELAVRRLAPVRLRQLLGVVLVIAAIKMAVTA